MGSADRKINFEASSLSPATLRGEQKIIDERGLLAPPNSSVLAVPTGFGKTFLARRSIHNSLQHGYRAIYLCPIRALASELFASWSGEFGDRLGVYTGETGTDHSEMMPSPREAEVMIFTPEKFDSYLRQWHKHLDWLAQVDLLVVDEVHTLDDRQRGATLESLISRFRIINPYLRVLALSATLGNPEEIAAWLKADLYCSTVRPIPLNWQIATFDAKGTGAKGKALIATQEAMKTRAEGGQTIVFVQSRPRAESLAAGLTEAGLRAAAHHAGISKKRRLEMESQFKKGEIDVLCATPTLAVGVNLPARKVILHDLQRFENGSWVDLSVKEIWQLGGRAGRRGLDDHGEVVLISPKHNQVAARRYIEGKFEPIKSTLSHPKRLGEQVLVLIGSRMCKTLQQVERHLLTYLIGAQQTSLIKASIAAALERMCQAGMLTKQDESYYATKLGYLAVRHQLSPETVTGWKSFADRAATNLAHVSMMDVLTIAAGSCDFNTPIRVQVEDLPKIADGLNAEPMYLKSHPIASWSPLWIQASGKRVISALKTALSLRAWTRLGDLDEVEAAGLGGAHEIEEARKEMVRMLQAFRALLMLLEDEETSADIPIDAPSLAERVHALSAMISTGLNEENASLALVDGIGPVLARRIVAVGIEDIEQLAQASAEDIVAAGGISVARAGQWIEAAGNLLNEGGAYRYRESKSGTNTILGGQGLDYYRWVRASMLHVQLDNESHALVTGGSEPHALQRRAGKWQCDCMDAGKGNLCKHAIAVLAQVGDVTIPAFDKGFAEDTGDAFSLNHIWNSFERSSWK